MPTRRLLLLFYRRKHQHRWYGGMPHWCWGTYIYNTGWHNHDVIGDSDVLVLCPDHTHTMTQASFFESNNNVYTLTIFHKLKKIWTPISFVSWVQAQCCLVSNPVPPPTRGLGSRLNDVVMLTLCMWQAHLCAHVTLLRYATGTFMCSLTSYNPTR